MSKQTAVEWYENEINALIRKYENQEISKRDYSIMRHNLFYPAKAMEKQQSISDYCEGFKASGEGWNGEYGLKDMLDVAGEIDAEDYYNKTYGGDNV
jgi:hypothetical protein